MMATKNSLPENTRQKVTRVLQERLSESIDLMQQVKQAHWNVKGPNFIALHRLFDRIHEKIETNTDHLAERIAQLGGKPEGTCAAVAEASNLPEYPLTSTEESEHIEALSTALAIHGQGLRESVENATAMGDFASADIFTQAMRVVDESLWFIESHAPSARVTVGKGRAAAQPSPVHHQ